MRYDALTAPSTSSTDRSSTGPPPRSRARARCADRARPLLEGRWRRRVAEAGPGTARQPRPHQLGRWRWPVLALRICRRSSSRCRRLCSSTGSRGGRPRRTALARAVNSMSASALAAVVAVVAALPIALLAQPLPTRWTRLLERLSFAGDALPGIVIASRSSSSQRTTRARSTRRSRCSSSPTRRFLPRRSRASSRRSPPSGRAWRKPRECSGAGRSPTALTVTVPLIRSGIFAGGALVFLSAMKELPATLLLRPIGFETLATEIGTDVGRRLLASGAPRAVADRRLGSPSSLPLLPARADEVEHG